MLGFYDILPPKPYGRGTAEWRWRDKFGFLQTEVSPSHGFAATASRLPPRSVLLLFNGVHRTPAPFRQGGQKCPNIYKRTIITYVTHSWGGAADFKTLAEKKEKIVIELSEYSIDN